MSVSLNMGMKCPKCSGRLCRDTFFALRGDEYLKCINCGWYGEVEAMNQKGTCAACERENVTLAAKGMCWKCYEASKKGKPVVKARRPAEPVRVVEPVCPPEPTEAIVIAAEDVMAPCLPKGFDALAFPTIGDEYFRIDDDLLPILKAAEVSTDHINSLIRISLARNGWL